MANVQDPAIQAIITAAITQYIRENPPPRGEPGQPGQPGAPGRDGTDGVSSGARAQPQFRPRDIGYFEPNPDAMPVEAKDSHNVYHNVFSFTNRLRVKSITMDAALLRQNLDSCLLGTADDWYTNQLSNLARSGLRNDPDGVTQWCDALETRFQDSPSKSLSLLEAVRYTVRDARSRRDPADYLSSIVLNSKNAGIATTEAAQVLLAYEHMDSQLRRDLPRPTALSTVADLMEELRHQKDIWFDIYSNKDTRIEPRSSVQPAQNSKQGQYDSRSSSSQNRNPFQRYG